jgi:hypothetical protein
MTGKELERRLADWCSIPPFSIDNGMAALREAGMVRYGGRGQHAPDLPAEDIATVLLGLLTTPAMSKAADYAAMYRRLTASGPALDGRATLGEALAAVISERLLADQLECFELTRDWPRAMFRFRSSANPFVYGYATPQAAAAVGFRGTAIRSVLFLPGHVIRTLNTSLSHPARGGRSNRSGPGSAGRSIGPWPQSGSRST